MGLASEGLSGLGATVQTETSPSVGAEPEPWQAPDYGFEVWKRSQRLKAMRANRRVLEAARLHYALNPSAWITDWVVTYDPRRTSGPTHFPMVLWPRQREYIAWLCERERLRESGLVEKSRDAGVSWLNVAFAVHRFLFRTGVKIGFGSRKEDLVDRIGDPDSLFEKARMLLRNLPPELLPAVWDWKSDSSYMRLVNRVTGSVVTGEAGDNIGRGGRSSLFFVDEAAFLEHPLKVEAALSQATDVRIDVSTPNGNNNPFYRKRFSGAVPVFTFHWRMDPRKNEAWYERQRRELDPVILASEVDIDYQASTERVCIPSAWIEAAVDFPLKAEGMRRAALDVADEGGDLNVLALAHGCRVLGLESWREGTTTQTARRAVALSRERKAELLIFDRNGVGAGVRGELLSLDEKGAGIKHLGVNTGEGATGGRMETEDAGSRKCKELFKNLRAELWWRMRRRFLRTFEVKTGVREWPEDELISIPNHQVLKAELSRPKVRFTDEGKILLEAKSEMTGGSPNYADAVILLFALREREDPLRHIF